MSDKELKNPPVRSRSIPVDRDVLLKLMKATVETYIEMDTRARIYGHARPNNLTIAVRDRKNRTVTIYDPSDAQGILIVPDFDKEPSE
ncbi:MAG: hypothetical protein ACPGO3_00140 [Magnetospiraceae bacterium]